MITQYFFGNVHEMKVFTAGAILFGVFLVFIGMPESILAARKPVPTIGPPGPHEEYQECGTWCPNTCARPRAEQGSCIMMCKEGNFCVEGYIRESKNGPCILPSECPRRPQRD